MKKSTEWIFFLSFYATVYGVTHIIQIVHPVKGSDPIYRRAGMCVAAIFWLGYLLYLWRFDIAGFLKRLLIAVPFALIFVIFMKIIGLGTSASVLCGLSIYGFLLFKTPNWKQYFSVILALASIWTIILKFFYAVLDPYIPQGISTFRMLFPIVCTVTVLTFWGIYMRKVEDAETINLRVILNRSFKFGIAFSLYFALFLTIEVVSKRYRISFPVSFTVSSLLTAAFFVICYLYDLFPIEWKKKIKNKSKLSKLRNQLNNAYLEECEKLKGKI